MTMATTFTVPVRSFLLKELEEAAAFAHQSRGWLSCEAVSGGRAWVCRALLDIGVPFDELYEAYAYLLNGQSSPFDCCKLQVSINLFYSLLVLTGDRLNSYVVGCVTGCVFLLCFWAAVVGCAML
jgi:hypothetical protein